MNRIVLSDRRVLQSYPNSCELEWLETNGTGAFAQGTVAGANTKRTHAHLIAPDGQVLLSKFDEELRWNGHRAGLSTNQYPGARQPRGEEFLEQFRLDPFPTWRYRCENAVLERSLFLVPGQTIVVVEWRLISGPKCWLEVRPFFARRGLTELQRSLPLPPAMPPLAHSAAKVFTDGYWYFNFVYDTGQEDLYSPALYQFRLSPGDCAWMAVAQEELAITGEEIAAWRDERLKRGGDRAEDFVVDGIRSGYPLGIASLEQELIALPGLLVSRGRQAEAQQILSRAWAEAKPSLWLFPALDAYHRKFGADSFLERAAFPEATLVLDALLAGVDASTGLLPGTAGENALWINALLTHNLLTGLFSKEEDPPGRYQPTLRRALAHYELHFWPHGKVRQVDPEQLLALSLPFPCVEAPLNAEILAAVMLTPIAETWLVAHYVHAYRRVHRGSEETAGHCQEILARVEAQLQRGCLGHLPLETESASAIRLAEYLRAKELVEDW